MQNNSSQNSSSQNNSAQRDNVSQETTSQTLVFQNHSSSQNAPPTSESLQDSETPNFQEFSKPNEHVADRSENEASHSFLRSLFAKKQNSTTKNMSIELSSAMELAIITTLLTVMYLIANIMAVKLVNFRGTTFFDAGTIVFPFAYILGDVLTEIWGFRIAKRVILLSFFCNILLVAFTSLGVIFPYPEYAAETADAYAHIFTAVPRIVAASLIAFLCGELANSWSMERIRMVTKGKHLWFRAIASSMVGYTFDTVIFVFLAFSGTAPWEDLVSMIIILYFAKVLLEGIFAAPFVYALVAYLKKRVSKNQQLQVSYD